MMRLAIATILSLCITTPLLAGIEPSPFMPEINKLEAVTNGLNSVLDRATKVLSCPPDDMLPSSCPNLNGAVNRLEAMDNQVMLLEAMSFSVIDEVLACPPDDIYDANDIVPALVGVRDASQAIADVITEYLSTPPDDMLPAEFINSLNSVAYSAQMMSTGVQQAIEDIEIPPDCIRDDSMDLATCESYTNCMWILETNGDTIIDQYCCCTP